MREYVMAIIRAKAPLRISFGGGGTDVSPYPEERGGAVISVTIDKYAYCTLDSTESSSLNVTSLDYNLVARYDLEDKLIYNGELDLVKAAVKVMGLKNGASLFLHSDMPPGSGLGTSSTMTVAVTGAIAHWQKLPLSNYEIAELAYKIERQEAGIKGGKQDQYAAAFGGFNFIEFLGDTTVVNPLRIVPETLNELQYRLMLCYTGKTRLSAGILTEQINGYVNREKQVMAALDETKELAVQMKNALLLGKIDEFGHLLDRTWESKKNFSSKITDPHIDELYKTAKDNGAIGGKLLGAGGGGYLLLLCKFDRQHIVARSLEDIGGKVVGFKFALNGLETWEVSTK
ncbi:MAG: GHMP kinase [Dehalococcoidia bacterium]